jgi:SAM-dependent methyltransferase
MRSILASALAAMLSCPMRWLLKAAAQKVLGAAPGGTSANYFLQRHVTRTLPRDDTAFRRKFRRAVQHFDAFREHGATAPAQARFYEFGPGWDFVVTLTYRALGVKRQTLVDVAHVARVELVSDTLGKFERLKDELEEEIGRPLQRLDESIDSLDELQDRFGITYLAPRDARATGLPDASVDFVSSSVTLEHVPKDDVGPLLEECRRLLKPDGVMSCTIDMKDHFAPFDRTLSPYNFLRFESGTWRLLSSPLNHQNRLRYPDYVALLRSAGFDVVTERLVEPSPQDLEMLRRLPLAAPFRTGYTLEELGVKYASLVLRPTRSPDAP